MTALGLLLQQPNPIIVQVVQQPVESTGLADVLIGAIVLTGALVLVSIVLFCSLLARLATRRLERLQVGR